MQSIIRNKQGFTLVEILSAITIIAILTSIIAIGISEYKKVQIASCKTTLIELETTREYYDICIVVGNTFEIKKACETLNILIDKYNEDECEELTGIKAEKQECN